MQYQDIVDAANMFGHQVNIRWNHGLRVVKICSKTFVERQDGSFVLALAHKVPTGPNTWVDIRRWHTFTQVKNQYWMVHQPGTTTCVMHGSEIAAKCEARRLANLYGGQFFVGEFKCESL